MTPQQYATLKTAIAAVTDPEFVALRDSGSTGAMSDWFNLPSVPAFYVKKSSLGRHDILTGTSDDGTTFAWAAGAYITRSQGERDAFREMFNNSTGSVDPRLTSINDAFNDIFSGAGGAGNRTHILAMSRRIATRGEAVFATGTGSKAVPGVSVFEGNITDADVVQAINLA